MRNDFLDKLIDEYNAHHTTFESQGLLSGNAGIHLFMSELLANSNPISDNSQELYTIIHEKIAAGIDDPNNISNALSYGLPGMFYAFLYGSKKEIYDLEIDENIDNYIIDCIETQIVSNNWDLLHGYIGLFNYVFIHPTPLKFKSQIQLAVQNLLKLKTLTPTHHYSWLSIINQNEDPVFNTGLAHGFPAIPIFLCKVYELGICQTEIQELLLQTTEFIKTLQYKNDETRLFPTALKNSKEIIKQNISHTTAWCYGDMGIIFALINIAYTLKDKSVNSYAYDLAMYTLTESYQISKMNDAMFCHGYMGTSHLYFRLSQYFKEPLLKEKADELYDYAFKEFYDPEKKYGGFEKLTWEEDKKNKKMEASNEILGGTAGVAMVIISRLYPETTTDWDLIFYTNIPTTPSIFNS